MSACDAWREVCMAEYRITGDMVKATAFADSVEQRIRAEVLREAAEKIREAMDYTPTFGARKVAQISENVGRLRAADLIDPEGEV